MWALCAYTLVATTLDVNVDSQTRQRDICVVDALNTALGQFFVLPSVDTSVPDRTLLEIFTNDSGGSSCMSTVFGPSACRPRSSCLPILLNSVVRVTVVSVAVLRCCSCLAVVL